MKASEFDAVLRDLENEISRLRSLYEQYFQGLERVPPVRMRERLDRQVRQLRRNQPQNTAMRFKYQTIFQRWITFTQYWDRIVRRIEEGTYGRDLQRVQRRRARRQPRPEADEGPKSVDVELDLDMDLDREISSALEALSAKAPAPAPAPISLPDMDLEPHPAPVSKPPSAEARRPAAPPPPPRPPAGAAPRPAPPRPPRPPRRSADERLRDDDVRKIFDRYVEARKQVGKRPDGVSYEKLASQIRKMEPELRRKHAGKRIDFEVVVKNGRVGLKPVARQKPGKK